jgi:hypothetical protein
MGGAVAAPQSCGVAVIEEVLRLYQERYFDCNVKHFHEKLSTEHGISLSYTWTKGVLQGAGLVKRAAGGDIITNGVRDGRCQRCSCPLTPVSINGFRMSAGMT